MPLCVCLSVSLRLEPSGTLRQVPHLQVGKAPSAVAPARRLVDAAGVRVALVAVCVGATGRAAVAHVEVTGVAPDRPVGRTGELVVRRNTAGAA